MFYSVQQPSHSVHGTLKSKTVLRAREAAHWLKALAVLIPGIHIKHTSVISAQLLRDAR